MLRSLLVSLAMLTAAPALAQQPYQVIPGHIDLARGPDGNSVILDAPQGLIVVDTGRHVEHAQAIVDAVARAGKPVAAIVNTHWHLDHTTGNQDILARFPNAEIVASGAVTGALSGFLANSRRDAEARLADPATDAEARARISRSVAIMAHPEWLTPRSAVQADGPRSVAGRSIQMHLAPNAATQGDVWMVLPDENLAIVGDLVTAPVPLFDTGCEKGWVDALKEISAAEWDMLIPGHGAPMNRVAFNQWHEAFLRYVLCSRTTLGAGECANQWMTDAAGLYTPAEAPAVRDLATYYLADVLRAPPEQRMAYCAGG